MSSNKLMCFVIQKNFDMEIWNIDISNMANA